MAADPLELEARRRIYRRVADRPGTYLRELQRDLGLAMGALEYHLDQLEKAGLVTAVDAANKRFFPTAMDAREKRVLVFLRQEWPRRILVVAVEKSPISKAHLMEALRLAPSTLNYHLRHLVAEGLLLERREGREAVYEAARPGEVARLLAAHRSTLLDRMVDRFLEGFEALR